jgi:hypothetical protein
LELKYTHFTGSSEFEGFLVLVRSFTCLQTKPMSCSLTHCSSVTAYYVLKLLYGSAQESQWLVSP